LDLDAIDADSKLIVSYMLASAAQNSARIYAGRCSAVSTRIQLTTDGHKVYADAVESAFGADIDYAC